MNNFEKIKNMTLDEMAEYFFDYNTVLNLISNKIEDIKQWLQQESEG